MKIYKNDALNLVRLSIKQEGRLVRYLNLTDTTHEEAIEFCVLTFSPFVVRDKTKVKTTIDLRDCKGSLNGKSQRISLYGVTVEEVLETIEQKLG